ncbi:MAG: formylglycine-generating enzyme family protein [Pseudoxanthomonas sp.]
MHTNRALLLLVIALAACQRAPQPQEAQVRKEKIAASGNITVSGDDSAATSLNWQAPLPELQTQDIAQARRQAQKALAEGRLYETPEDAIPLYLAIERLQAGGARDGLDRALAALLKQGDAALAAAVDEGEALRRAGEIGAVARTLDPDGRRVAAYLDKLDAAELAWKLNLEGERELREGRLGETGGGALAAFRAVLETTPKQARALQGVAAVESAMIRHAEDAARASDFDTAAVWLVHAQEPRGKDAETVSDAQQRVENIRDARVAGLRDAAIAEMAAPLTPLVLRHAREKLAEALRIAAPGDPVAVDFRQRVELATYYGRHRPGQSFTDEMPSGRGPQMVVVPHGAFTMGASASDGRASEREKPAHYVRFDRGFAMSRTPVTVAQFRRFVQASGYRPRAVRRGHSVAYDERSGNFVRRSGVDWQSDYAGGKAADDQPVLHVSVHDAEAYAEWLSRQTGHGYRLPSEAEYEYTMRAGRQGRYAWGDGGEPPKNIGNLTGGNDVSPGGRRWNNAFIGYGDGHWGPAPAGSFADNPWGLADLGSNVSEWVADCWHASYRRAPADGAAWFNPGCRARLVRGGSWASSPEQTRAAWRSSVDSDMTNARIGFRVARGI